MEIDALEERVMLAARVLVVGDSWAQFSDSRWPGQFAGNGNGQHSHVNTGIGGHTAAFLNTPGELDARITQPLLANPTIDMVHLSIGGNDFLGAWKANMSDAQQQSLFVGIQANIQGIVNHILSIRPNMQVTIASYDYLNLYDTVIADPFGAPGVMWTFLGQPSPFQLNRGIFGDQRVGGSFDGLEDYKRAIAATSSRVHYSDIEGFMQIDVYGTTDMNFPTPTSRLGDNGHDPIHLNNRGHDIYIDHAFNGVYNNLFAGASLAATPTLSFGNVRVGTTSGVQNASVTNTGLPGSRLEVTFGTASGAFSGGGGGTSRLFVEQAPLVGDGTSRGFQFAPNARGGFNQNVSISTNVGASNVALGGQGVGPVFQSVGALDLGDVGDNGTSLAFDVTNGTGDGELGALTHLTLHSATITGPDAERFLLVGFVAGSVLAAGDFAGLTIEFDGEAPAGDYEATLTFSTDVGAAFGGGGGQFSLPLSAVVTIVAPTADAGGPYATTEMTAVELNGGGTGTIDTYEWDLDDDGEFETSGAQVLFMATDNGAYPVALRVTGPGGSHVAATIVEVGNVAPSVTISGSRIGKAGVAHHFVFDAVDPSPEDQAGGFTYEIDWNGDGVIDQTVAGGASVQVDHTFATNGSFTIGVRATDKDGDEGLTVAVAIHDYLIAFDGNEIVWHGSAGDDWVQIVQTSPTTIEVRTLQLGGIGGLFVDTYENGESVRAFGHRGHDRLDASQLLTVGVYVEGGFGNDTLIGGAANDVIQGEFVGAAGDGAEGNDWIEGRGGDDTLVGDGAEGGMDTILGGEGNDLIWGDGGDGAEGRADSLLGGAGNDQIFAHTGNDFVDGGADHDLLVGGRDGSEGSDTIISGSGNDILVGGGGNDRLVATGGSNLLLGGRGSDTLVAGGGGDVLVADATNYDLNPAGLTALRNEWTSGGSYASRISNLRQGGGLNGVQVLGVGVSVVDDAAVDHLLGNDQLELNWYVYNLLFDQVSGRHGSEVADDTEGTAP